MRIPGRSIPNVPVRGYTLPPDLTELAWALLGMLHRHNQGGPRPPSGRPFEDAYRELEKAGLLDNGRLTSQGENALYARLLRE